MVLLSLISDPLFYCAAIPAVLLAGISKGGFAGGLGVLAVPLLSLTVGPLEAAAIMLPLLCFMDLFGVWAYRGKWDMASVRLLVPAAMVGILVGTLTFRYLDVSLIRILIGAIAILFTLNRWYGALLRRRLDPHPSRISGGFWGAVAGFTSFIAHAGGPPISMYLIPLRLDRTVYQATTVIFFISINYVKLVPYAFLGQLKLGNLNTSLVLAPLVPLGMGLGIWLHRRTSDVWFYRLCYVFLFITGLKLLYDGVQGWLV